MIKLTLILLFAAAGAFWFNAQNTYIAADGVLHETIFLPLGFLFLLLAIIVLLLRFIQALWRKKPRPA
ncbi:MAG: DUF3955 domain-containing protein [Neisseriaceae bacterium]|nr:DUF3955 domain-containing protein [Neisseriaceae bacterium]MBP6862714.1 DUF3955 domain-containing protein [Neisseriaceae bacterium]